jgi:signal transduction histidine kinase
MEIFMLSFAIAMAVVALVLYFELRNTQERFEKVRHEMESRINLTIQSVIENTSLKIPQIESRLQQIADMVEKKEDAQQDEENEKKA